MKFRKWIRNPKTTPAAITKEMCRWRVGEGLAKGREEEALSAPPPPPPHPRRRGTHGLRLRCEHRRRKNHPKHGPTLRYATDAEHAAAIAALGASPAFNAAIAAIKVPLPVSPSLLLPGAS